MRKKKSVKGQNLRDSSPKNVFSNPYDNNIILVSLTLLLEVQACSIETLL